MCGIRTVTVSLSGLSVIMNWTPRKRLFILDWCVFHCANAHILHCTQLVHNQDVFVSTGYSYRRHTCTYTCAANCSKISIKG